MVLQKISEMQENTRRQGNNHDAYVNNSKKSSTLFHNVVT
jgi:hypothetical protein